jgi:hypothetical protein
MYNSGLYSGAESIPSTVPNAGEACDFGRVKEHKSIGYCVATDCDCNNQGAGSERNMCCFRLGPFYDRNTNALFRPKTSSDITDARLQIPVPAMVNMPGTSDYQYLVYNFTITGGGPGGSVAELQVGVKKGPVMKRAGSGTMYGSVTGANLN